MLFMLSVMMNINSIFKIKLTCHCFFASWNDKVKMMHNCTGNEQLFRKHVLSISDEVFMLLVLMNYTT